MCGVVCAAVTEGCRPCSFCHACASAAVSPATSVVLPMPRQTQKARVAHRSAVAATPTAATTQIGHALACMPFCRYTDIQGNQMKLFRHRRACDWRDWPPTALSQPLLLLLSPWPPFHWRTWLRAHPFRAQTPVLVLLPPALLRCPVCSLLRRTGSDDDVVRMLLLLCCCSCTPACVAAKATACSV